MSRIEVIRKKGNIITLTVSDHAGFDEAGKDLCCAALSAISIGALNALDMLFPQQCDLTMDAQGTVIRIQVLASCSSLQAVLEAFLIQFQTLQEQFPEYISIYES